MSALRVSVVVPTYNRAGMVEAAIESVLSQDYDPLEVIALDDGSTDETPAVLERIAERTDAERFRWSRHENVGQARTINRGFEQASGDLLGYLSSDDALLPGAVRRLVEVAGEHPDADVIYPWFQVIDEMDRVVDTIEAAEHTFVEAMRWAVCIPGAGALVRRRLYERIGGWDPTFKYCPDFEWWLRAGEARFVRVPEPLALWRSHGGSITVSSLGLDAVRERLRLLDELYAREDLPAAIHEVKRSAYAATLIQSAFMLDGAGLASAESRFVVEDRLGPMSSRQQRRDSEAGQLELQHSVQHHARHIQVLLRRLEEQQESVVAIDALASQRAARVAQLERELAAAHAEIQKLRRPMWLRLGRALTPPALRPRLGTAVHRLRGWAS